MELFAAQWSAGSGWSEPLPDVDGPRTLVLVFGGSAALAAPGVADVVAAYPTSVLAGCSTAGEIQGEQVHDDTVTVSIARFRDTTLTSAAAAVGAADASRACGEEVGRRLRELDGELRAAFVLSDGLQVNGSEMTEGLAAEVGPGVAITGGLAGDGDRFGSTWVLVDGELREGWVTAVGLSGPHLEVGHGSRGGWDIFGPERRVTRAQGNVLFELDGAPALTLYKTYLGERAEGLPATALLFPLAVRAPGADDRDGVVRTILAIDEEAQTMTFAGDVPEGSLAQLMRANLDRLIDGAHEAALATAGRSGTTTPTLAIAVSCVGRRLVLGARTEEELEVVLSALGPGARLTGFYSYGEISPGSGACALHNQTMTLTTFRERPAGEG
ncbi:MAG TPA: FIST N-terminal domain-containing protein [Solirubrobacteraceae bacterium]